MTDNEYSFIDGVTADVTPLNVWEYFNKNNERLEEYMVEIAFNENNLCNIYLTDENGFPRFIVDVNNETLEDTVCFTENETVETLRGIYSEYLISGDADAERKMQLEMIGDRESELYDAFIKFMETVTDYDDSLYDGMHVEKIEEILDHVIEYIASKSDFQIYRPRFEIDKDGAKEFVEYL